MYKLDEKKALSLNGMAVLILNTLLMFGALVLLLSAIVIESIGVIAVSLFYLCLLGPFIQG